MQNSPCLSFPAPMPSSSHLLRKAFSTNSLPRQGRNNRPFFFLSSRFPSPATSSAEPGSSDVVMRRAAVWTALSTTMLPQIQIGNGPSTTNPPSWTGAGYPYIALTTQVTSAARQWPAARLCCSSGASSLFQALAAKLKHPALLLRRHFLTDSIITHQQEALSFLFLSRQFLEVDASSTLT